MARCLGSTLLFPLILVWKLVTPSSANYTTNVLQDRGVTAHSRTTHSPTPTQYTYTAITTSSQKCPTTLLGYEYYVSAPSATFTAVARPGGTVQPLAILFKPSTYFYFFTSNSSRIILLLNNGQSVFVDNSGVRLLNSSCEKGLHLPITNLASVLTGNQNSEPWAVQPRQLALPIPRKKRSRIDISVKFQDQCGRPARADNRSLACASLHQPFPDDDLYTLINRDTLQPKHRFGTYTGSCMVPNTTAMYEACQGSLGVISDYPSQGFVGALSDPNLKRSLQRLGMYIRDGSQANVPKALAKAFDLPSIAHALLFLAEYATVVEKGGRALLEQQVCSGAADWEVDVAVGYNLLAELSSGPFTDFTATSTMCCTSPSSCDGRSQSTAAVAA